MDEDTENSPGQPTAGPRRSAQREAAELRACEPFIQGMLKNYSACGCPINMIGFFCLCEGVALEKNKGVSII